MNLHEIMKYEKQRHFMMKKIRKSEDLKIDELIILDLIRASQTEKIDLKVINNQLKKIGIDINRPMRSLHQKGFFMKSRHKDDERIVEIINVDYKRIDKVFNTWKKLLENE